MAMLTKVILKDDQLVPVVVEGVMVWVYSALDVLLTQGLTDVNGEVSFMLDGSADPGTEYILRFRKDGWSMTSGPTQKIRVLDPVVLPDTNIFDVQAHEYVHPESTDPPFCVLSGYLIDIFGRAWADRTIEFHLCPYFPETAAGGLQQPLSAGALGAHPKSGFCHAGTGVAAVARRLAGSIWGASAAGRNAGRSGALYGHQLCGG